MDRISANTMTTTATATGTNSEKTEGTSDVFASLFQTVSGEQKTSEELKEIPLTNEQLAMLLQQFGATPALLAVLMENPTGNPAQTLAAHPELLGDLSKVMTTVMNAAVVEPHVIQTEAKLANLMKSVMAQLNGQSGDQQQANVSAKAQAMLGKLQATMTSHVVRTVSVEQMTGTATETTDEAAKLEGAATNAPTTVTLPFAQTTLNRLMQPVQAADIVVVKAENLAAELPEMVIKRASLIEAPGRHDFRIILEPQGLGEIEIHVQKIGNQISLQINAENVTTKGLLDTGIASLKTQLQAQGIQYDRIEVNNSGNGMGELNSGFSEERGSRNGAGQGQQSRDSRNPVTAESFSIDAADSVTPESPVAGPDGIDVSA